MTYNVQGFASRRSPLRGFLLSRLALAIFRLLGFPQAVMPPANEDRIGAELRARSATQPQTFVLLQEAWDPQYSRAIRAGASSSAQAYPTYTETTPFFRGLLGGHGLSLLSSWTVVSGGVLGWRHLNILQAENTVLASKGFTFHVLQHPQAPGARLVVYNLHASAMDIRRPETEQQAAENFRQLGQHVAANFAREAVLVGGDFNWRHRWRPAGTRTATGGAVDAAYNAVHRGAQRFDAFGELMTAGGLRDYELIRSEQPCAVLSYAHTDEANVDRFFVKDGTSVRILPRRSEYLRGAWDPLSDHNPIVLRFDIEW